MERRRANREERSRRRIFLSPPLSLFSFSLTLSFPHSLDFFHLGVKMRNNIRMVLKSRHYNIRVFSLPKPKIYCDFDKFLCIEITY